MLMCIREHLLLLLLLRVLVALTHTDVRDACPNCPA
jgi:hypothetical protein